MKQYSDRAVGKGRDIKDRPISLFIPGLEGGGAQRVFVTLANSLAKLTKHPVHLVVIREGGRFEGELSPNVYLVNLGTKRVRRTIPALTRYLKANRPIVLASTLNYSNIIAILAWQLAGRPCRLVIREANVVSAANWVMLMLMKRLYPYADCVIALSPEIRASLLRAGVTYPSAIVEIGNPAPAKPLHAGHGQPTYLPQPMPRFLCAVGRLEFQKGFDVLLSAFATLEDLSMHLVILGEGSMRASLAKQCKSLSIEQRVHMPGFTKCSFRIISQAQLFVLSSRWEGFPNVLLEALATGTPVVATDCPGASRYLLEDGRHGHLVPPDNSKRLCDVIESALSSPAGTAESRRARADNFSAETITREYLEKAFMIPAETLHYPCSVSNGMDSTHSIS